MRVDCLFGFNGEDDPSRSTTNRARFVDVNAKFPRRNSTRYKKRTDESQEISGGDQIRQMLFVDRVPSLVGGKSQGVRAESVRSQHFEFPRAAGEISLPADPMQKRPADMYLKSRCGREMSGPKVTIVGIKGNMYGAWIKKSLAGTHVVLMRPPARATHTTCPRWGWGD